MARREMATYNRIGGIIPQTWCALVYCVHDWRGLASPIQLVNGYKKMIILVVFVASFASNKDHQKI